MIILLAIIGCSCSNNKELNTLKTLDPCMQGFVLIVYIGENSAPIPALLIRTDEKDSTYYKRFVGESREMFLKNHFIINESWEKDYMKKVTISEMNYNVLKKYIVNNNTGRKEIDNIDDYSFKCPIKVFLSDNCDSIVYIVNTTDTNYFKNLLDTTQLFKDEKLNKQLIYYKGLQEFDYEKLRKRNN